jgi:protoporphyrinogen oxidase
MKRQHVIIVGAGAAGLIAAVEIAKHCDVTILETNNRTGGRIRTMPIRNVEGVIEPGAEFVHGDTPVTTRLAKRSRFANG